MRSVYGHLGFRAILALLALQLLIFVGLLVSSLASNGPAAPAYAFAQWILVAALALFLIQTWSVLSEAAFCLGYYLWKKHTAILRAVLLVLPLALVAGDWLRMEGANPIVARLPLLIASTAGTLLSLTLIAYLGYQFLEQRWRDQLNDNLVAHCEEKFGADQIRRVADSVNYYRGRDRNNPFPARRGLNIADLPTVAWRSGDEFAWKQAFIDVADDIRAEALEVCIGKQLDNYNYPGQVRGAWNSFWLVKANRVVAGMEDICPQTVRALRQVPGFPFMTEAFYSVLQPGSRILPHNDESNLWVVAHFGIDIPEQCGIRVGRETRRWKQDEFLFFDACYQHEAWNDSDRPRIVLLFDFPNPALNEAEREFMMRRQRAYHPLVSADDPVTGPVPGQDLSKNLADGLK
jgi:hypothetical protein